MNTPFHTVVFMAFLVFTMGCASTKTYFVDRGRDAAGLLASVRLGFNVGELLDFVLGWTTLDIYADDTPDATDRRESSPRTPPAARPCWAHTAVWENGN